MEKMPVDADDVYEYILSRLFWTLRGGGRGTIHDRGEETRVV